MTTRTDYRHIFTLARREGWRCVASPDDFPIVPAETIQNNAALPPGHIDAVAVRRPEVYVDVSGSAASPIPQATRKWTDQANANRVIARFGADMLAVEHDFYCWCGTHWVRDTTRVHRYIMQLSSIIEQEVAAAREKVEAYEKDVSESVRLNRPSKNTKLATRVRWEELAGKEYVQALRDLEGAEAWQQQCEMQSRQDAAFAALRKVLDFDSRRLNTHRSLFNAANCTVDLRTGEAHAPRREDYLTSIAPTRYASDAQCPRWETFVREVVGEESAPFAARWLGYSITGETSEQKLVLHIGQGSNGKSTLFRVLERVLGPLYCGPGAPELLTGQGGRHPTEIADLIGKRMVLVHESEEGSALRESLVKQMSGEDTLKARFMRQDFVWFTPTFKLQLLTNHEPVVRGSDTAIWRRLLLLRYPNIYDTAEKVRRGEATHVGDPQLTAALLAESEGILAWLVRGAKAWYESGLEVPEAVQAQNKEYREEQDRVKQFVGSSCILDAQAWAPYSGTFGALYPAYVRWCKESGYIALGLKRFATDLLRAYPKLERREECKKVENSWRTLKGVRGIRVNIDGDGGGEVIETNAKELI